VQTRASLFLVLGTPVSSGSTIAQFRNDLRLLLVFRPMSGLAIGTELSEMVRPRQLKHSGVLYAVGRRSMQRRFPARVPLIDLVPKYSLSLQHSRQLSLVSSETQIRKPMLYRELHPNAKTLCQIVWSISGG